MHSSWIRGLNPGLPRGGCALQRTDWSEAPTRSLTPMVTGCHRKLGERPGMDFPSEPEKEPALSPPPR